MDSQINMDEQLDFQSQKTCQQRDDLQSKISVSNESISYLLDIAKWTRFLTIVSCVAIAIFTIGSILLAMSGVLQASFCIIYVIMCAIYWYPLKKAFGMSTHMKHSALLLDSEELENGLGDLRAILRYMGILTIIMLALYGFAFVFFLIGLAIR